MIRITYQTPERDADQPSGEWTVQVDAAWNINAVHDLVTRLDKAIARDETWRSVLRVPVPQEGDRS